jgi:hypothetical protein
MLNFLVKITLRIAPLWPLQGRVIDTSSNFILSSSKKAFWRRERIQIPMAIKSYDNALRLIGRKGSLGDVQLAGRWGQFDK